MANKSRIFYPIGRVLFDVLICTDLVLLLTSSPEKIQTGRVFVLVLLINLIEIIFWFTAARWYFRIELTDEMISGPSTGLHRISIERAALDRAKSDIRSKISHWIGYRDLFAADGTRIRLYRRILGRRQIYKILQLIGWIQPPQQGFMSLYPSYPH